MKFKIHFLPRQTIKALLLATTLAGSGLALAVSTPAWAYVPPEGYADLVDQVSPAVVYIEVTSTATKPDQTEDPADTPFNQFLKRFGQPGLNGQSQDKPVHGLGSGYIISANGEIVTNYHVVENATEVKVKLQDGREFLAKVVGSDKLTDVALLRIDDVTDLPTVPFGDSAALRVGDAVLAVGNPFGLGGTVTAGIVSALGRDINFGPYDSYIQTDAAINRGNSGGPLFNTKGQVVGMNSAIFSPTGGSVGIGFSIPADTVQKIVNDLRDHGSVSRGWLGVQIQEITPDLAQALNISAAKGALVADVQPDSPALKAGIRKGDVILGVNGTDVQKMHDLPALIAAIPAEQTAVLDVLRDAKQTRISVVIGALNPGKMQLAGAEPQGQQPSESLGITVQQLTSDIAQQLGLSQTDQGVVVTTVDPNSANADKLQPGDVIQEAGGEAITTPGELAGALTKAHGKTAILLRINRRGTPLYVGAELENL